MEGLADWRPRPIPSSDTRLEELPCRSHERAGNLRLAGAELGYARALTLLPVPEVSHQSLRCRHGKNGPCRQFVPLGGAGVEAAAVALGEHANQFRIAFDGHDRIARRECSSIAKSVWPTVS